ncbi:MAG: hypothetical protein KME60_22865, partial [Cyanomargarita calcarea GSE-NOS-MK-12-04C]|nr:hypothetical protein [Cyanomargarita calcarea GSE-NOS-MK-12-04C]
GSGIERIFSNPIAREESEPVRVDETCDRLLEPPPFRAGVSSVSKYLTQDYFHKDLSVSAKP